MYCHDEISEYISQDKSLARAVVLSFCGLERERYASTMPAGRVGECD
jgi:hypothetical protein